MERIELIEKISQLLLQGKCDLFVGSGVSIPSNVPSWVDVLESAVKGLNIKLDVNDDLPLISQYVVNNNSGNRNIINGLIFENFSKDFHLNSYHTALANIKFSTIWTTNYDCLLESTYKNKYDCCVKSNDMDMSKPQKSCDIEIIKIHGCIKDGDMGQLVFTQDDYDNFAYKKPVITQRLRDTLLKKSMFFIGYGYRDPNIRNVMLEAMKLSHTNLREHFIILYNPIINENIEEEATIQKKIRFDLWVKELNRLGIREHVISENKELTDILNEISLKIREKTVYFTGSHQNDESKYAIQIAEGLAEDDGAIYISGQSAGIGSKSFSSFMTKIIENKKDINARVKIYPNPYFANPRYANDPMLLLQLKQARSTLMCSTRLVVLFAGGMGTQAEIEVAKDCGCQILPIIEFENDYYSEPIKYALEIESNNNMLKNKFPQYWSCLLNKNITPMELVFAAIKGLLE